MQTAEIMSIRTNSIGTTSFDMKLKGWKKSQDFIVYPIEDNGSKIILIQSHSRMAGINPKTGHGFCSASHPCGAYGFHLTTDRLTAFTLSDEDRNELFEKIRNSRIAPQSGTIQFNNEGAIRL